MIRDGAAEHDALITDVLAALGDLPDSSRQAVISALGLEGTSVSGFRRLLHILVPQVDWRVDLARKLRGLAPEALSAVQHAATAAAATHRATGLTEQDRANLAQLSTLVDSDTAAKAAERNVRRFQRASATVCLIGTLFAFLALIPNIMAPSASPAQLRVNLNNVSTDTIDVRIDVRDNRHPAWRLYTDTSGAEDVPSVTREYASERAFCPVEMPGLLAAGNPSHLCGWIGFGLESGAGIHSVAFPAISVFNTPEPGPSVHYRFIAPGPLSSIGSVFQNPNVAVEVGGNISLEWYQSAAENVPPSLRYTSLRDKSDAEASAVLLTIVIGFLVAGALQPVPDLIRGASATPKMSELVAAGAACVALTVPLFARSGPTGAWWTEWNFSRLLAAAVLVVAAVTVYGRQGATIRSHVRALPKRVRNGWPRGRMVALGVVGALVSSAAALYEIRDFPLRQWLFEPLPLTLFSAAGVAVQFARIWIATWVIRPVSTYLGTPLAAAAVSFGVAVTEHLTDAPFGLIVSGQLESWAPTLSQTALLGFALTIATGVHIRWRRASLTLLVWGVCSWVGNALTTVWG